MRRAKRKKIAHLFEIQRGTFFFIIMINTKKRSAEDKFARLTRGQGAVLSHQNKIAPREGEMALCVVFMSYNASRLVDGKNTKFKTNEPPAPSVIKKKDGTGTFPAKLEMNARISTCHGAAAGATDGSDGEWKIMTSKVTIKPAAEEWIRTNGALFYAEGNQYTGRNFRFSDYITPDGVMKKQHLHTLYPRKEYKFSFKDTPDLIFRRKKSDERNAGYVVTPYIQLNLNACVVEVSVDMPKNYGADDQEPVPIAYVEIHCKAGAELIKGQDLDASVSDRIHQIEDKDVHNFVRITDLRQKHDLMPRNIHAYVTDRYVSPEDAVYPIQSQIIISGKMGDFLKGPPEDPKAHVVLRHGVCQGDDVYQVKFATKNAVNLWKNYGITDQETFAMIMLQNPVFTHLDAEFGLGDALKLPDHEWLEARDFTPEDLENEPALPDTWGYYTYWISLLTPDYVAYLSRYGLHVSWEWVENMFADAIAMKNTKSKDGKKQKAMFLHPHDREEANPLHDAANNPVVFSLGTPQNHGYNGDFLATRDPADWAFFVMTSHPLMNYKNEQARADADQYAGYDKKPDDVEDFVDRLINEAQVKYWVMAVKRSALEARAQAVPRPAKRGKPLPLLAKAEADEASEVEEDMDEDEE